MVHAGKCLNTSCDSPVQIPWKENCQLVRKPDNNTNGASETVESESNHNGLADELTANISEANDVIRCDECGTKYTDKHVEDFVKAMEFTELHLQSMKEASVACILFKLKLFNYNVNGRGRAYSCALDETEWFSSKTTPV